jgi:hypothetical protein
MFRLLIEEKETVLCDYREQLVLHCLILGLIVCCLTGCVTATIEKDRQSPGAYMEPNSTVIVLGRRHNSDYETEPDFVECVADHMDDGKENMNIISEREFVDMLYPWFEPRIAPLHVEGLHHLMKNEAIAEKLTELNLKYIIWVDGSTQTSEREGSITCGIATGTPISCFGFGSWSNDSNYETSIWDFRRKIRMGRISTSASGQSYMPAVVIPIPIIAPVKSSACSGLAEHIRSFIRAEE